VAEAISVSIIDRKGPILAVKYVVDGAPIRDKSQKWYLVDVLRAMDADKWRHNIPIGVVWKLVVAVAERERASIHKQLRKHTAATADVDTDCKGYC
jgi:hypothetical protein